MSGNPSSMALSNRTCKPGGLCVEHPGTCARLDILERLLRTQAKTLEVLCERLPDLLEVPRWGSECGLESRTGVMARLESAERRAGDAESALAEERRRTRSDWREINRTALAKWKIVAAVLGLLVTGGGGVKLLEFILKGH